MVYSVWEAIDKCCNNFFLPHRRTLWATILQPVIPQNCNCDTIHRPLNYIFLLKWYSSRQGSFTWFQRCCEHKLLHDEFTDFKLQKLLLPPFGQVIVIIVFQWQTAVGQFISLRWLHRLCSALSMIFLWSHWFWFLSMTIIENTSTLRTWCFSFNN